MIRHLPNRANRGRPTLPTRASELASVQTSTPASVETSVRASVRTWAVGLVIGLTVSLAGCGGPKASDLVVSAKARIAKKDTEGAKLQLKSALQKAPNDGEARFLLGQLLHDSGDMPGAEVELRRALEKQYPEQQVLPLLASAMLAQGKGALVLQQFNNTRLADPAGQARLGATLAAAEAASGDLGAARQRLDTVLRADPENRAALLLSARLAAAAQDTAGALAQVQALLKRLPDDAEAWILQGDLLLRQAQAQAQAPGQPKPDTAPAVAAYREALKRKPDSVTAHAAIISMLLGQADLPGATTQWQALQKAAPKHPQTSFLEAVLAQQRGDTKRAGELAQLLVRNAPENPQLQMLAGQSAMQSKALGQAELHFAKAVQLQPKATAPRLQLAQVLLRGGQADKALSTLGPLLEAANPEVEALTLAAQAQVIKGDTAAADATFARAAKLKPDDLRVRMALALSKLAKGGGTAALADLRAVAAADKKGASADLVLINALSRANDLPAALKAVDALAAKLPDDALPDQLRGRIALQRKDAAGARAAFEKSLTKNPDFMPSLAGLAALDMNEKQPEAAKARFEAVLKRNPKNTGAMLALAELNTRNGGKAQDTLSRLNAAVATDPTDVLARLLLLDHLMGSNQTKLAIDAAQAGLVALPDNTDLLDRLGQAQLISGNAQQAVSTFTKLASVAPRSFLPQLRLADAQAALRNASGVAAAVRRAAELAPDNMQVMQAQVTLALSDNRPEQALTIARKLQTMRPDDALGYSVEGEVEVRRKNWDAAAAVLRKAVARKQPGDAPQRLQAALMAAKKTAEADAFAADWRKKHPEDTGFAMHLGDQALLTGKLDDGAALYRQVLELQPDHVLALNNLAFVTATQKKPGAVAMAEKALQRAPKMAAVMDTLAFALAAEQNLPRAVVVQKQAVAAAPEAYQFRLQLAKLLIQSGDKVSARSELSTLAALGNKFSRQDEVAALVKQADQ